MKLTRKLTFIVALAAAAVKGDITCGTAGDATLSSCQGLLASSFTNLNYGRTCSFGLGNTAFNPICAPDNCCIHVTVNDLSDQVVHDLASDIVNACAAPAVDRVNGRNSLDTTGSVAVCVSDGAGCGDCFED
ncbi:hypothetical protein ARMGADRAFT_1157791 [Armillaria gallica]|uniref:Hydrophobin n=1 Tax=Armillaria gallica TaxID=47427 RepID=A0A2H3EC84_ARMGA|nr:hypothetical protein ARMGADRAFT_1157791 [Armillaria gallica]